MPKMATAPGCSDGRSCGGAGRSTWLGRMETKVRKNRRNALPTGHYRPETGRRGRPAGTARPTDGAAAGPRRGHGTAHGNARSRRPQRPRGTAEGGHGPGQGTRTTAEATGEKRRGRRETLPTKQHPPPEDHRKAVRGWKYGCPDRGKGLSEGVTCSCSSR